MLLQAPYQQPLQSVLHWCVAAGATAWQEQVSFGHLPTTYIASRYSKSNVTACLTRLTLAHIQIWNIKGLKAGFSASLTHDCTHIWGGGGSLRANKLVGTTYWLGKCITGELNAMTLRTSDKINKFNRYQYPLSGMSLDWFTPCKMLLAMVQQVRIQPSVAFKTCWCRAISRAMLAPASDPFWMNRMLPLVLCSAPNEDQVSIK